MHSCCLLADVPAGRPGRQAGRELCAGAVVVVVLYLFSSCGLLLLLSLLGAVAGEFVRVSFVAREGEPGDDGVGAPCLELGPEDVDEGDGPGAAVEEVLRGAGGGVGVGVRGVRGVLALFLLLRGAGVVVVVVAAVVEVRIGGGGRRAGVEDGVPGDGVVLRVEAVEDGAVRTGGVDVEADELRDRVAAPVLVAGGAREAGEDYSEGLVAA
mmetsp:Transcript_28837/g.92872  ORF Transcript_28837/g.92872 Transcript_28837/m.92872 type:complete len:211 (-) Transcript_28837:2927-3559(-)